MTTASPHIHEPDDGRGPRDVFLAGELLADCFYADTLKGIARCYVRPLQLEADGETIKFKTCFGEVRVVPKT